MQHSRTDQHNEKAPTPAYLHQLHLILHRLITYIREHVGRCGRTAAVGPPAHFTKYDHRMFAYHFCEAHSALDRRRKQPTRVEISTFDSQSSPPWPAAPKQCVTHRLARIQSVAVADSLIHIRVRRRCRRRRHTNRVYADHLR